MMLTIRAIAEHPEMTSLAKRTWTGHRPSIWHSVSDGLQHMALRWQRRPARRLLDVRDLSPQLRRDMDIDLWLSGRR